ncbi:uncharacterized protein LOC111574638 [Amphiprion ocellaris]|uniref:S100P-binding protein n=1 Tax=Amphiprion ocellaris TaxID=80972 RepID=A0A3Q1B050_AMPOC|nr:uncharacterized protein LOC111574638 [Amphiprion ocellaris]XP_054861643.1 uncharacterized protein LOC111574638 [Amphiprion ocellaris]
MDEEIASKTSKKIIPPEWPHLKPLSDHSRRVTCDQKTSLHPPRRFSNPFINFKIEVVSNCTSNRKMDDSSVDEGYETPAKKAWIPKALSPDLGCYMDYCSPLTRRQSVSPLSTSNPAFLHKTQGTRSATKENVNRELHLKHLGSSTDPGGKRETVSSSVQGEKVPSHLGVTFNCDVDDILCDNPRGTANAAGFSDDVESCRSLQRNILQNVAHGQVEERGDGQVQEGRAELKKDMCLNVKDDKGYFSVSSFNDRKIGTNPPDLVHSSSPLLKTPDSELSQDKFHPESSSEPQCCEQAAIVDDFCPSVSGPLLQPMNFPVECLQGAEEMLDVGPPIFESSVCDTITDKLNTSKQSDPGSEETQEDVTGSVHDCQDTACDSSSSTTLPLQMQVKSKVVIPTSSNKPVAPLPPGQNTKLTKSNPDKDRTAKHVKKNQRTVTLKRGVDWEYRKNQYVHSVTQHMTKSPGANHGVMSELLNLMSHVAKQTAGSNGTRWQHPSDLTRRNYQESFGNATPRMTLRDWLARNSPTHKRFAKVPKRLERTPFP